MSIYAKLLTISYSVANCNVSHAAKLEGGNNYPATITLFCDLLIFFQCFHGQLYKKMFPWAERPPSV
jgi:hypothetical protein